MTISTAGYPWYTPYAPVGFKMATAGAYTFSVTSGITPNSDYSNIINMPNDAVVSLQTVGLNGLDTGALEASTWYAVFAIGSSNNPIDDNGGYNAPTSKYPAGIIVSKSSVPSLPFNYDMYRRIGNVYATVSTAIQLFLQTGSGAARYYQYSNPISVLTAGTAATYTEISMVESVPYPQMVALLNLSVTPTAAGGVLDVCTFGTSPTPGHASLSGSVAGVASSVGDLQVIVGSSGGQPALQYRVPGSASISTIGYFDYL